MDNAFFTSHGPGRAAGLSLFDEDFDQPPPAPPPPEPEAVEPVFSAADLAAARVEAAAIARATALAEAEDAAAAAARQALARIAEQLAAARQEAASVAERSAETATRLLLDCFAAAFPALSERHGPEEIAAVLRTILPALRTEPNITVRVHPRIAAAIGQEIERFDHDLAAVIRLVPTDAMARADVRIAWQNGGASRDTQSLWQQIEAVLAPAGLLSTAASTAKEPELVE